MKSFKFWKTQEVEETFGIEQVQEMEALNNWLQAKCEISEREKGTIESLRKELKLNATFWNEAELKMGFLAPLLRLINYSTKQYKPFFERTLVVRKEEEQASGKVDFVVAQGKQIPRTAFFCIHEYKPEQGSSNDVVGQLLMGMLAAQAENEKKRIAIPIYGAYFIGRFFFFVLLKNKTYAISDAYVATQADIYDIFCILRKVKWYINRILEEKN